MKKLTIKQKQQYKGGSFYAVALGIGILTSTITNLISTTNNLIHVQKQPEQKQIYAMKKDHALIRFSPVPSRSAILLWQ